MLPVHLNYHIYINFCFHILPRLKHLDGVGGGRSTPWSVVKKVFSSCKKLMVWKSKGLDEYLTTTFSFSSHRDVLIREEAKVFLQ